MRKLRELIGKIAQHWLGNGRRNEDQPQTRLLCEWLEERTLLSVNPIVLENQKPGNPISEWGITGAGDPSIQGYATDISVNKGQTIGFKINTDSRQYVIDIYRMGYYGGMGARKIDSFTIRLDRPQPQPAPIVDTATGLVDAGNWRLTATWQVPMDAVSGIYFAKLTRLDGTGGSSHIYFVVRDDDGRSDILVQTSDTTWQAYNSWGGKSLYDYLSSGGQRAYKVSYNRPLDTRSRSIGDGEANFVFWAEYPLVRWLEGNGYNVSYFTNVDTARYGAEIKEHKVFISVGHDEYWSAEMWQNVQAARDAGVHVVFLSGNNIYWKVRWEASIDGTGTPYRTLVCYKESLADAKIDPLPNVWTGLWRDPRFSPPADGGIPENLLGGTIFTVNRGPDAVGTPIEVPYEFRQLRIWRHTDIQNLQPGQVAQLGQHTLGYEWNEDLDNGFRPAGQIRLSSTTQQVPQKLLDYGKTVGPGVATHALTMYRAASGAIVFSAGTVQWVWGLDANHDGPVSATDLRMQQAIVNLFADMGVQPDTLQPGLVIASPTTDFQAPVVAISNASGVTIQTNTVLTLQGSATDLGGGVVAGVEVSWDNGRTWHPAVGTNSWLYRWTAPAPGTYQLLVRAIDDSINIGPASDIIVSVISDDTTPPIISNVSITVRPTQATISWNTNEAGDSIVYYGTSPDNLQNSVVQTGLLTVHQITLNGLSPNTTYYARLSSADISGNRTWYPTNSTLSFRTPAFVYDTYLDFQSGFLSGGATITSLNNGEVSLRANLQADFTGDALSSDFTTALWATNGSVTLADGYLRIEGAMVSSIRTFTGTAILEFRAKFSASPYQHIGFSNDLNGGPWIILSTKDGSGLYARSYAGSNQEVFLGSQWLGSFHLYRIEWTQNTVLYFIDDVLVAQHNISLSSSLAVIASDYIANGLPLEVDWMRIGPYETVGSYLSEILDAGVRVFWDWIEWNADVPPNASLNILVRMGNSPTPDDTWTAFIPVAQSGTRLSGTSRYLQFLVQLNATTPLRLKDLPKLDRLALSYSPAAGDSYAPSVIATKPAANETVNTLRPEVIAYFDELLDSSSASSQSVQVRDSVTGQVILGTVDVSGNRLRWLPSQDLVAGTSYTVVVRDVRDLQGNRMPQEFRWTFFIEGSSAGSGTITHDTVADFQGGLLDNTIIFDTANGSVTLRPSFWDTFATSQLDSHWSIISWQSNGSVQLVHGVAQLNGSAILSSQSWTAGRYIESRALFTGSPNQHLGLAQNFTSRYWAIFSVGYDGKLYARTQSGKRRADTLIPGNWFNQYHTFRVEWLSNRVQYYIDNNLVVIHNINIDKTLRVGASDLTVDTGLLSVDWIRMGPFATAGSYTSPVIDAGRPVEWAQVVWRTDLPSASSLSVYVRAGNTPQPDSTWTPYIQISGSGANAGLAGRYVQYRLVLSSNDAFQTPTLDSISLSYTTSQVNSATYSTVADLSQGSGSNVVITDHSGGELQLKGQLNDDFVSSTLDTQWNFQTWSNIGGGPTSLRFSDGLAMIGGGAIMSAQPVGIVAVQANLSFSNVGYQNFGLATGLDDPRNHVWLLLGTSPDGTRLLARSNVFGSQADYDLGPIPTGLHNYKIVPYADRVQYFLDDILVADIPISLPQSVVFRLVLSDYYGTVPLIADWAQAAGFPAQGTYLSPIVNANIAARWTRLTYSGRTPSGTAVIVETRTGDTAVPDSSWSTWTPVGASGAISSPQARYLQFRVILLSGDINLTPIIEAIRVEWLT